MVAILSKNNVNLFISYGPGTGSTALEQHLRTCCRHIEDMGFRVEHLPVEDFGINSSISRHICYSDFLRKFGVEVNKMEL